MAAQVDVCAGVIEEGVAATVIEVMVKGPEVTVMLAEPDMLVKPAWAEWAVQVPVPVPEGVKTPPDVMLPPVAVQVTAVL